MSEGNKGFAHLAPEDACARLDGDEPLLVADIRDPQSYAQGHIPGSVHLSNANLADFIAHTPKTTPIAVCCYHGISSQNAAQLLAANGFTTVYSLDGGFEHWRLHYAVQVDSP